MLKSRDSILKALCTSCNSIKIVNLWGTHRVLLWDKTDIVLENKKCRAHSILQAWLFLLLPIQTQPYSKVSSSILKKSYAMDFSFTR